MGKSKNINQNSCKKNASGKLVKNYSKGNHVLIDIDKKISPSYPINIGVSSGMVRKKIQKSIISAKAQVTQNHLETHEPLKPLKSLNSCRIPTHSFKSDATILDLKEELQKLKADFHMLQWYLSIGVNYNDIKSEKFIPVKIYIPDPVPHATKLEGLVNSITKFLNAFDFDISDEYDAINGSWYKKFLFKTREVLEDKKVKDKLDKAEKALELAYLDKPQAEANKVQAEAAACLIANLKDIDVCCAQLGSLLVIKNIVNGKSCMICRTLNQKELKFLEENQNLLSQPDFILDWLQQKEKRLVSDIN